MTPAGWISRAGLRLAFYCDGDAGPPLVFQHGLCGDANQVAEAMRALAPQRWHTLECRGHGASHMGAASIAAFADDLAALIETLPAPVVLGGISMGAAIATRLAVTRPELLRALVLVRPAWVSQSAPANMEPNAQVGALLATDQPSAQARDTFAKGATAARLAQAAPDNLASLLGFFTRAPRDETATLLTSISADGPGITAADLRALRLPVLICGTRRDAIHPLDHAQTLATLIPQARLVELPPKGDDKTAHLAALAAAMTHFLKEISDAPPRC